MLTVCQIPHQDYFQNFLQNAIIRKHIRKYMFSNYPMSEGKFLEARRLGNFSVTPFRAGITALQGQELAGGLDPILFRIQYLLLRQ
jgi:hypothetical protein